MNPIVALLVVLAVAGVVFVVVKNRGRIASEVQREKEQADAVQAKATAAVDAAKAQASAVVDSVKNAIGK